MRRENEETAPDGYKSVFEELFLRCGLPLMDHQIFVPFDLRKRLLDIHLDNAGTKMLAEIKILKKGIEQKDQEYTVCLASDKHLKLVFCSNL